MRRAMIICVALAVSCSGGEKSKAEDEVTEEVVEQPVEAPPQTEAPQQTEAPADQGEGIPFDQKTHEQKAAYMKLTVLPRMKTVFQEFDPDEFEEVKCSTCHGDDAKERHFEMPSPDLPKIDFEHWQEDHPEMVTFMQERVVPEMAALLGEQPFDPETKQGFGCTGCHSR